MCSGRVEPEFILEAFKSGADGVMVVSCRPKECHYQSGNYKTLRRVTLLKTVLTQFGIEPERLSFVALSPNEATSLPKITGDFTRKLARLERLRLKPLSEVMAQA